MQNTSLRNIFLLLFITLVGVNVFVWVIVLTWEKSGVMTVAFLDVGQGDAIFIEAPNKNQVLIDGGADRRVLNELGKVMPFYDRSIDVVIATHPDQDHIGGLLSVVKNFKVDAYFDSGKESNTDVYQELEELVEDKVTHSIAAKRGMRILLDEDVYIDILFPFGDLDALSSNDTSVTTKLVHGNNSVLLTGDASIQIEQALVTLDQELLDSDILKLGHHGSRTSSSWEFLKTVTPALAVVSAGKDNKHGHPHENVVKSIEQLKVPLVGTYEKGTIVLESDGEGFVVK